MGRQAESSEIHFSRFIGHLRVSIGNEMRVHGGRFLNCKILYTYFIREASLRGNETERERNSHGKTLCRQLNSVSTEFSRVKLGNILRSKSRAELLFNNLFLAQMD